MFKLPFFSQQGPKDKILGVDIGSMAIKLLEPEEVCYSSAYLDKYSVFDTDSYTEELLKRGLEKAWRRLNCKNEFDRLLLSLPPSFFKARTESLMIERGKQGKISKKEKKELIDKARKRVKKRISAELGILTNDLYFKNWDLIKIKIDGYPVSKLKGYDGKQIEMRFLVVFLLSKYLKLREMVEEKLDGEVELVHLSQGILRNKESLDDGIYLDVGGEITQLFLIKDQELQFAGEVKVGGRTFAQILEENLGLNELRSKVLKERYAKEELSPEITQAIRKMLRQGKGYWLKEIKNLLQKQETKSLPSTFYLFGGGSKLSDIQAVIKQEQWENFAFLDSPQVQFLTPRSLGFNFLDVQYTPLTLIVSNYA